MTTGKTVALTRQIFVGKVMSLLFNMLSRLVINFSSVILEPKKIHIWSPRKYIYGAQEKIWAEYILRNAGLDEAQSGIEVAGRNINNLRYADDTILMAESEKEPKSLLTKVEEESEKVKKLA